MKNCFLPLTFLPFTFCFFAAATAVVASDPGLAGGPFVVNVTARAATIVWLVDSGDVRVKAAGATEAEMESPSLRVEKSTLTGLKPNTKYEYHVPGYYDSVGSFRTAPVGDEPFDFVAYGDNRTRPDVHQKIITEIVANGTPDMVLQTGDLVADGSDTLLWRTFFDIEKPLLRETAFFPSLGNHEHNARNFYELTQTASPYYSFDWGSAHFAVIDTDIDNISKVESVRTAFWAEQTHWLEEDLKTHQQAQFRFVAGHHPPYTAVASRQGDNPHIAALTPWFERYHVTAGFFGHDHNYQHYLRNGIHYVTSGGGGAPLYDVDKPPVGITEKVVSVENYVSVHVAAGVAHVRVYAIDGKVIDEFEMKGWAQPKPVVVTAAAAPAAKAAAATPVAK